MRRVEGAETHKKKADWPLLLEAAGLGPERLLREIRKRFRARTTHFWQDHAVTNCEDNATRMRATELLADLLGKRKAELNVHHDLIQIVPAPRPEESPPGDG